MEIEIVKNSFSKIVSSAEMKNLEWKIFRNGVTSELLMEKAGISGDLSLSELALTAFVYL